MANRMAPPGPFLLLLGLLGLLALLAAWRGRPPAPTAPSQASPSAFATPDRNVRPEVQYVGDESCARCHARQAESYRQHPMGRSLAPVAAADAVERYDPTAHNPFEALGFRFERGD